MIVTLDDMYELQQIIARRRKRQVTADVIDEVELR